MKWEHYWKLYRNKKIRQHYEQLYVKKLDHLDEKDKLLETQTTKTDRRNRKFGQTCNK